MLDKIISPLIAQQFPNFYRENSPEFIAFVRAYYEWMEQSGRDIKYTEPTGVYLIGDIITNQIGSIAIVNLIDSTRNYIQVGSVQGLFQAKDVITNQNQIQATISSVYFSGVNYLSRSLLEIIDVDQTQQEFIDHFKHTYLLLLPKDIISNKQLLVKHILDLYRSKGTPRSYELLFRLLFDEDIELYIPNQYILKPSDGEWKVPSYIETTGSLYLYKLIGKKIYSSSGLASAVVENYYEKIEQNRVINVLNLTSLQGRFKYGEYVVCPEIPELSSSPPIMIIGSLMAVAVENGGYGYNIGDITTVKGSGSGGKARVVSTRDENGKVVFTLLNGGSGYSLNSIVTVANTSVGGTGATFTVGGLTNLEIYNINTDIINDHINTLIDSTPGMNINVINETGVFTVSNTVTASANIITFDCTYLTGSQVANGESLSNTSLGISNLIAYRSDGPLVQCTGPDANLVNANIVSGTILTSNTSKSSFIINTAWAKETITGSGNVVSQNTSVISLNTVTGYFIPTNTIVDTHTGHIANVVSVVRNTDWFFSATPYIDNLDTPIVNTLNYVILQVGTITYLNNINPGSGYTSNPIVMIEEPYIHALNQPDGSGGIKGYNAVVNAIATNATGIVTAAQVIDSGFGYNPGETVTLNSANTLNQTVITGISIVDMDGIGTGGWKNDKGFISDINYVQDSYFYQQHSYQIIAQRMISTYEKFVRDIVHPAGVALFGKFQLKDELISEPSVDEGTTITQTIVS